MKKYLFFALLLMLAKLGAAQDTYLQIKGEAGLSVYVNGTFKCRTTAELNGCIIPNIVPGANLIKVSKEGYTPYEETITIKKGEVFAYTVKPFTKHAVSISQEGNTAQTDKKAGIKTGKLIIQSVPIEISITIPDIEGVDNMAKTRDQWIAESLPAGSYPVTFRFNDKTITKTVEVAGDNTTSIFINMLTGEFTSKNTLDEKVAAQRERDRMTAYVMSVLKKYHFKGGLSLTEFVRQFPAAQVMLSYPYYIEGRLQEGSYQIPDKKLGKSPELVPGFSYLSVDKDSDRNTLNTVQYVVYTLAYTKDYAAAKALYTAQANEFRKNIKGYYLSESDEFYITLRGLAGVSVSLQLKADQYNKGYYETSVSIFQHQL